MDQENHASDRPIAERPAGAESLPLLTTKVYRPPVRPDLMRHTRLMEGLMHNRHQPLALIAALALSPAHPQSRT